MSKQFNKLSHTIWQCRYHVVFCPKGRFKILKGRVEEHVRNQVYWLCQRKDKIRVVEINIQVDHVHLILEIPPKYSVSETMGYLKGKIAISMYREFRKIKGMRWGRNIWSRGYCVSSVGLNETQIRKYVAWQQEQEKRG